MKFWKLLTHLWSWGNSSADRRRVSRRTPTLGRLSDTHLLEDRSVRTAFLPGAGATDRARPAEVVHLPIVHRQQQIARTRSQYFRLSVVIVDYLLEHEWYWLLTGYRTSPFGDGREPRGRRDKARRLLTHDAVGPSEESNRTACVGDAPWSIVAAIEQTPPPGSTTTTDE